MRQRTYEELLPGYDWIREAPLDAGRVELIVRRPGIDQRELLSEGQLDQSVGLVGDNWLVKGSSSTPDGSAHPLGQVTLTSWRSLCLLADTPEERALAGDQIYADLDLSEENLPAGTLLTLGSAVLEVTEKPHTGCSKFRARFGGGALRFVNTGAGAELRLRGINTRVVQSGIVSVGDSVLVKRAAKTAAQPIADTAQPIGGTAQAIGGTAQPIAAVAQAVAATAHPPTATSIT